MSDRASHTPRWRRVVACCAVGAALALATVGAAPDARLPDLTQPVNDLAHVIDPSSAHAMDQMIRRLKAATGDVVIVATIDTVEPYADIREYANALFQNNGKGICEKGKDNGVLILLALKERSVRVEVGYTLEQWVTDGFAGDTSRTVMAPAFRAGQYGAGLRAGTERIIGRIAQGRGVSLEGVRPVADGRPGGAPLPLWAILIFILVLFLSRIGGGPGAGFRRRRYWGGRSWSGWSSGVGPFGGGFGGGGGGGGASW